jgi:hypothetical protein
MKQHIIRLWRGEIGLARTFWEYAIAYAALANLAATILAFAVIASDGPALLAMAIFFLPLPYNVLAVIIVWRSAARHKGDRRWADAARVAVILWAVLLTLL